MNPSHPYLENEPAPSFDPHHLRISPWLWFRSTARWIAEGIAKAGLQAAATGTGIKGAASHSLRHSCARHWLQSGLNVNAVSAWLGHSSPTVTLNTYLVLAPDTLGDISEVP